MVSRMVSTVHHDSRLQTVSMLPWFRAVKLLYVLHTQPCSHYCLKGHTGCLWDDPVKTVSQASGHGRADLPV